MGLLRKALLCSGILVALGCATEPVGVAVELHMQLPNNGALTKVTLPILRVSLQPEGRPRSVDWARYPTSDGWWDAGVQVASLQVTPGGAQVFPLGEIRPPEGRWQRVWLDLDAADVAVVRSDATGEATAVITEDHAEPTALRLSIPEDLGKTLRIEVVALPSGTQPGAWILAVKAAALRP